MSWPQEIGNKFGGVRNGLFLLIVLVVCLRFAGAEWKDEVLGVRLLYGLYLILATVLFGGLIALIRVALARRAAPHSSSSAIPANVAGGLRSGIGWGGIVIFVIGILMVDDYLGPLKNLFDLAVQKIAHWIP
jgi:hypothetical protein